MANFHACVPCIPRIHVSKISVSPSDYGVRDTYADPDPGKLAKSWMAIFARGARYEPSLYLLTHLLTYSFDDGCSILASAAW
jgi:hypothetical protein